MQTEEEDFKWINIFLENKRRNDEEGEKISYTPKLYENI
jgi:hypothetical protein